MSETNAYSAERGKLKVLVTLEGGKYAGALGLVAKLNAPSGVFSILGNHDHWADTDFSSRVDLMIPGGLKSSPRGMNIALQ
ncbi:hypothetical protein K8T06_16125 [bacterium]|nr:hypothetical protein [bacterium]